MTASSAGRVGQRDLDRGGPVFTLRTARDLASTATDFESEATPMARAVARTLMITRGRTIGPPLPRPATTRVIVVANQKGGVGKTTTAVNLGAALAQQGAAVLVVDLDPQGNTSTALGIEHAEGDPGIYDTVVEDAPIKDLVRACKDVPGLFGVPATIDLAGAEIELVSMAAREGRLKHALQTYLDHAEATGQRVDYVLIDCPPSLGLLTLNALVAAQEMLIPIQCEYYALEGLGQLLRNVELVREHLNPQLRVSTILLTMSDSRTRLSAGVADEVREHFGSLVLRTAIPRSVRISEAPSYGQSVMTYDPGSSGALSYAEAAREVAMQHAQGAQPARQDQQDQHAARHTQTSEVVR